MVTVGYRNRTFDDEDVFFSATRMLLRWGEISGEKKNPILTKFGHAMNHWLNISQEKLDEIDKFVIEVDFQTNLGNDIIWRSEIYKELKPTSPIYNVSDAFNEYYLYGKNVYKHKIYRSKETEKALIKMRSTDNRGQGAIAYWNTTRLCPSIKEYTIHAQDFSPLRVYTDLMKLYSYNLRDDFTKLIRNISLLACLCNDHKGLVEELTSDDKVRIGELTRKIFTFPIVYAIHNDKKERPLENVMRLHKHENGIKELISTVLDDVGALAYSENNINHLRDAILNEIERLGGNQLLKDWINEHYVL